jgi:outer membrane protein assembly factor BamD
MISSFHRQAFAGLLLVAAAGCLRPYNLSRYQTQPALFTAGVEQLRERKWGNAVQVFEKLTLELPARDTLLPLSNYYLAQAYAGRGDHLLAAQSYIRVAESFATDTLADNALYRAGREYQEMWRNPTLDAQYGGEAAATFELILGLYPDSEFADSARAQLGELQQDFATKDYETGMFYMRRKAYDSAIIYFRDVLEKYPNAPRVRDALLRLAEAYEEINYRDDRADICRTLRERYPGDGEVREICGAGGTPPPPSPGPSR